MSSGGREAVRRWLSRLPDETTRAPRRLVYALPPRSLVEPMAAEVAGWLAALGLADRVALHVVMARAGELQAGSRWRQDMHGPAVVIGTTDALVSKALNRGYGVSRLTRSIDFALTTNGAHWIFDEASLCPTAVSTVRQIALLAALTGSAEPFEISCMSAIAAESGLPGSSARHQIRRLAAEPGDCGAIAAAALARHRAGTRTLIALNTVAAARQVHAVLADGPVPSVLVHTQFRGRERQELARALAEDIGDGQIVVATQAVEAGLNLDATLVVTEAAPGVSIALRAVQQGTVRRDGDGAAELLWLPPASAAPYEDAQVAASIAALADLEGQTVTVERLAGLGSDAPSVSGSTGLGSTGSGSTELGPAEIGELFDTESEVDIERYVSDADDLEAQLTWATWQAGPDGCPPADARIPSDEWRCRAPLTQVAALATRVPVWRMDRAQGCWTAIAPGEQAAPGEVLLVAAAHGGYDPVRGFDPELSGLVPDSPAVEPQEEVVVVSNWVSLRQHSEQTRDQAAGLLGSIKPVLADPALRAIVCAAYLHDAGKAHPIWQDALCALAADDDSERVAVGRPWAKSGMNAPLVFAGDVAFRHELGSLLLLDGPLRHLVDGTADRDLVRYLVLAHHGRLRVRVGDPDGGGDVLFGLEHGAAWSMPSGFGQPGAQVELAVDLDQFSGDGDGSWATAVRGLLDRYGPFVLAYLETIVRVADWRASGGDPVVS